MKLIKKLIVLWDQSGHDSIFFTQPSSYKKRSRPRLTTTNSWSTCQIGHVSYHGNKFDRQDICQLCTAPTHRLDHKAGYSVCDLKGTEGSEQSLVEQTHLCCIDVPGLDFTSRLPLHVLVCRDTNTHRSYCPHTRSAVTLYSYSYSDDPFSIGRGSAWKRKRSVLMMTLLSGSITIIRNTMTCS